MTSFSGTVAPVGVERLVIDGEDVTARVERFQVVGGRREVTTLTVELTGSGNLAGDAVVEGLVADADRATVVREFLADVDPQALDAAMASNPSMGRGLGETALKVLSDWAGQA